MVRCYHRGIAYTRAAGDMLRRDVRPPGDIRMEEQILSTMPAPVGISTQRLYAAIMMIAAAVSLCCAASLPAQPGAAAGSPAQVFDVVVYGGTAGGVIAAVSAARMGLSVALVEPSHHLGGMTTGGLSATD